MESERIKMNEYVRLPNSVKLITCGYDKKTFIELKYKISENIKDLCDVFVLLVAEEGDDRICHNFCEDYETAYKMTWVRHNNQRVVKEMYGAIWTNKGLIYVAQLNEKGELELL